MADFRSKLFDSQPQKAQLTREETDFESLFTGSEEPRRVFDYMVRSEKLIRYLLFIHGLGGIGKSSLLKMYRLSCRRNRIPVGLAGAEDAPSVAALLADWAEDLVGDKVQLPTFQASLSRYRNLRGRVETEAQKSGSPGEQMGKAGVRTAVEMATGAIPVVGPFAAAVGGASSEAFMDWLRGFLPKSELELYLDPTKQLTNDFITDLTKAASKQRIVLMADTYEQMTTLDDWMCDFARRLPDNVLLVIAGRAVPDWERDWIGWLGRTELIELKEMTPDNLRELVRRRYVYIHGGEPDPKQVEAIVEFARGLPMVATTVVQIWAEYGVDDFQAVKSRVVESVVNRLFVGVPKKMRPAFEAAAVLRYFSADSLAALLGSGDAEELYAELRRWPFIRARREGLAVHDSMRQMINEELKTRAPERFSALHLKAAVFFEEKLATADEGESERLLLEWLHHLSQTNEEINITVLQKTIMKLARSYMVERVKTLLDYIELQGDTRLSLERSIQMTEKELDGQEPSKQETNNVQGDQYIALGEQYASNKNVAISGGSITNVTHNYAVAHYDVSNLPNPYLGLKSFDFKDDRLYAGREDRKDEAITLLTKLPQPTILFIVGASGCGKSSFARACLAPALISRYRDKNHLTVRHAAFSPGTQPILALADALVSMNLAQGLTASVAKRLTTPNDFYQLLKDKTTENDVNVLIIDQFEELFPQGDEAQQLLTILEGMPTFEEIHTQIIITIRADYHAELTHWPNLKQAVQNRITLPVMQETQLRTAILQPVRANYPNMELTLVEPALVKRLAEDAVLDPAYLPLLQVTLRSLWDGGSMRVGCYDNLSTAIEYEAERIYNSTSRGEPRSVEEKKLILELLLSLIRVLSLEDPRHDTRRGRNRNGLIAKDPINIGRLVDELVERRILSEAEDPGGVDTIVNIIHEALISRWSKLRDTLLDTSHRELLWWRTRFEQELDRWLAHNRDTKYLLHPAWVEELNKLKEIDDIALATKDARDFLQQSLSNNV